MTSPKPSPKPAAIVEGWETVIGLEVHAELATKTKMFSAAPNHFGNDANTNIDPVSLGLPGSLPVLNEQAVELAIRLGLALDCSVEPSVFSRKNYFYPDMPKDFQISQYDKPINVEGSLELPTGKRVRIERAHLEEDTGKSTHVGTSGRISGAEHSIVDYNRAGVPLVEVVSGPDMRSADEARAYVSELRSILVATGVSDGKMEEGSMRVDANVSVRRDGQEVLGTRCEIKNLNSLRSLGRAIEYEARRQVDAISAGERVIQQTRHWDEADGRTHAMRSKEEAEDYRYFPEPDLVPLAPDAEWVERVRASLPLLPAARRRRLAEASGSERASEAVVVVVERGQDEQALAAIEAGADAGRVLIHVQQNLGVPGGAELDSGRLAALVKLETTGRLTATQAKQVLVEMLTSDETPEAIAAAKGFEAMDDAAIGSVVDEQITSHPDEWAQFCSGDPKVRGKLTGFFVGQVMRATKGQADGKVVTALLNERS